MEGDIFDLLLQGGSLAYYAIVGLTIVMALVRKREPQAVLGWILAIIFLPFIGILLFLVFGLRGVPRRLKRKGAHHLEFPRRLQESSLFEPPEAGDVPQTDGPWQRIARMAQELAGSPRRPGNSVELLGHGQAAFDEIIAAVDAATDHIHVEEFIFRHDEVGERFLEALSRKAADGVEVRLLVDAFGSIGAWRLLRRLRRRRGFAAVFMPLFPLGNRFAPNLRNHRKTVICDGKVGFFGGLNVGREYLGRRSLKRRSIKREWCDLHVKVAGPAVWDMQRSFVEVWDFATGELLSAGKYFPRSSASGDAPVQIVNSGPDRETNPAHLIVFTAITRSRKRLLIASPYVVPSPSICDALKSAALAGVEVVLLTQSSPPDHWVPYWASRYLWDDLLASGVRIFQYKAGMMHAKMLIADGEWACCGSANLDNRSLVLNFEIVGLFEGAREVANFEERFNRELARADEVRLEDFRRRGWGQKVAEIGSHLFAPLL